MWFAVCEPISVHIKQLGQIYWQDFCNPLQTLSASEQTAALALQLAQQICSRLQPAAAPAKASSGLDGPISWRLHTSAQQRWGRHRGILFQPIPAGCFGTQGHVGPHGHPEIEYKAGIQHGALAIVLSSFINSALLLHGSICAVPCSFLMLPWASTAVFSTGLVLRSCS